MSNVVRAVTSALPSKVSTPAFYAHRYSLIKLWLVLGLLLSTFAAFAQTAANTGQIAGVVKYPNQAVVSGTQVVLTNPQTKVKSTTVTNDQGVYVFSAVQPGTYVVEVNANGLKSSASNELRVVAGKTVNSDFVLTMAGVTETVNVTAGAVENAYRVDYVKPGGPLGTTPILDLPYEINVISRQLIDDTQSRNFKEIAKYMPLVSFREQQGPEILRPETRGMQGSNMQNDRKDGMGFAVTTPSALEEYEQVEVIDGLGAPLYGPANPSGMFNFVTKRPTELPFRQIELGYEGSTIGTVHTDLGGRFGRNKMFGYRTNLLIADGSGYVTDSQLRRQLAAVALDVRLSQNTVIEGNFSYYNLFQHGYPGWFAYNPTLNPTVAAPYTLLPVNAPDPTRRGFGQSFSGVDLTNQIGEVRVKHNFGSNWQLVTGVLNQVADRNINTAVNSFIDNKGNYKTYFADTFQPTLAPRFHVQSDLGYLTGRFKTGRIGHDVVIGSTGYKFASYQPVVATNLTGTALAKTALCTSNTKPQVCQANINDPLVFVPPVTGIPSFTKTTASNGIYPASIIHQQGFSLGDTITLTPRWLLRVAASQDWIWTDNYVDTTALKYHKTAAPGDYLFQGVSPSASLMFKPRANMTIYGTFASSIQAPDIAQSSTSTTFIVNGSQALSPYRSKEGEIGYKLVSRRINFSTAFFRIERPFANYALNIVNPICGKLSGTANCEQFKITGNQLNYGVDTMLSGRIFESLVVTGGLSVLNPKLTDTGLKVTDGKTFVGIPDYKSNIFGEYRLPVRALKGTYLNSNWQHVGRRPLDDINSTYTPQYNTFDLGLRYTTEVFGKVTTWRVTANNVSDTHYWSTVAPGSITGVPGGSYLGHLGEPRLITASMRFDF